MEVAPEIEMGIQIQTPGPLAAFSAKSKGTTKLTVLSLKADLTSEETDFKEKEDIEGIKNKPNLEERAAR